MLKQSLKLIGVMLLLAALLPLTGCEQATDSGTTVFFGRHSVHGSVTAAELQAAADNARLTGEPLVFAAEGATIAAGPGLVDFTGIAIKIEGPVTTSGGQVILDASRAASLVLTGDGALTVDVADYLIYAAGMELDAVTPNTQKVLYTPDLADITGSVVNVAVDEFLVKDTVDDDIPPGVTNLFVIKKASVLPEAVAATTPVIYALGEVELLGNITTALATATQFVLTSSAKLVNGTNGHVRVTLPTAALPIAGIDLGGPTTGITLDGITGLTVKKLTGPGGPLTVPKNIPVTIEGGDGDIVIGDGTAITFTGAVINKSTGKTFFNAGTNATTFGTSSATPPVTADIAGPVEFSDSVATGATGQLKFGDKVILSTGETITLTAAANTVTLGNGASIWVKNVAEETLLLTADAETVLTPTAGLILTAADTGVETGSVTESATAGGHGLTISSGSLVVAPGASYVVSSVATNIGTLTVGPSAALSFATDGAETAPKIGKLVLTGATGTNGAKLAGTGKIIAGGAEITGAWQAVSTGTDAVTLSYDGIAGTAAVTFTAAAGAGITVPAGAVLTIPAATTIALANDISASTAGGTITLQAGGGRAEGGKIIFAAASSVIQSGDETDGTAITVPSGAFVLPEGAASGKITISSSANVKVNPGSTTGTKLNSIKVTGVDEYIQAFSGEGADGVIGLNTAI